MSLTKPFAILAGSEPILRCYDIEAGYAWIVEQDLIQKAREES